MSGGSQRESDEEFDARYEAYFNRDSLDGWEIRSAMNELQVIIINNLQSASSISNIPGDL